MPLERQKNVQNTLNTHKKTDTPPEHKKMIEIPPKHQNYQNTS